MAVIEFTASTFRGLESSKIVSIGIMISGEITSSKDIKIPILFTPKNATGLL